LKTSNIISLCSDIRKQSLTEKYNKRNIMTKYMFDYFIWLKQGLFVILPDNRIKIIFYLFIFSILVTQKDSMQYYCLSILNSVFSLWCILSLFIKLLELETRFLIVYFKVHHLTKKSASQIKGLIIVWRLSVHLYFTLKWNTKAWIDMSV
jgi:hypothetical protein